MSEVTIRDNMITDEAYSQLVHIIEHDQDSIDEVLTIMQTADYKESEVHLMSLLKVINHCKLHSKITDKYSELKHNFQETIETNRDDQKNTISDFSSEVIYNLLISRQNSSEIEFVSRYVNEEFNKVMDDYGFSFPKWFDIQLIFKSKTK